ncbi:protein-export membrane protein SecD [Acidothermus cellulolyticus 11B]|uniref:Protein translocase subunit SecD n=1 Tax=Acidothermus cellulolyticus (strain ATCC 43068 / DSM 8971 / 11B) TaxID=351607 RepID=A0LUK3_ACIC1|nr:protein-export membrane protein SecD [Acidothermus cellulolyticus 11B]
MPPVRRSRPSRGLLTTGVVLAALYGGMAATGHYGPQLGLDLRGGTTVTLAAKPNPGQKVTSSELNTAVNILRNRVNGLGVANADVHTEGTNIVISVPGKDKQGVLDKIGETALLSIRQVYASNDPVMTGVTAPGLSATPSASPPPAASSSSSASPSPSPSPSPSGAASPATPKPSASSAGLGVGRTPGIQLAGFVRQAASAASSAATASPSPAPTASPAAPSPSPSPAANPGYYAVPNAETAPTPQEIAAYQALDCTKPENQKGGITDDPAKFLVTCGNVDGGWYKFLLYPTLIEGKEIASASAQLDPQTGTQWTVQLTMKSGAASRWAKFTAANVNKDTAIVLDGLVMSAEYIAEAIPNGKTQISGNFTHKTASELANVLKYGALPLRFEQQSAETVSATLGNSELRAGLLAGMLGLLLVILYSIFYYRGLSLVTVSSLALSAAIQYPLLVLLGQGIGYTLTLAGIAGLIVAVGVTADSFVVFFERLRDEVREGNSLRSAVEKGWLQARRTIVSADLVSLIAAIILYWLAVGDVRGFAFTLGLSTIVDLFIVFAFTKPLVTLLSRTDFFGNGHRFSGLDPAHLGITRLPGTAGGAQRPVPARRV